MGFRLLLIASLAIILNGCGDSEQKKETDSSSPRIPKSTRLESPKNGTPYTFGSPIHFEIASDESVDSVVVEFGKESRVFNSKSFDWLLSNPRVGTLKIRVMVYFKGTSETHYPRIILHSDIQPEWLTYSIQNIFPHNKEAYTQGLFFKDDTLIESTGQNGTSWISKVSLQTGQVYQKADLDSEYFGEGAAYWGGNYYQLTWTSEIGFIYDHQFQQKGSFNYTHQGWGMATWGDTLLVSDGTEVIRLLDPRDLSEIDRMEVYTEKKPLKMLNELEVVGGLLYANIYPDDEVAIIDLPTGRVVQMIDFSGMLSTAQSRDADALNGIALHPVTKKLYVTGKLWPSLFEVKLTPKPL